MGAARMLFDHLVTGGVIAHNSAFWLGKGKTPVLQDGERVPCDAAAVYGLTEIAITPPPAE